MALSKQTQNHDDIQAWAEERGGKPAVVSSTESDNETGIIRMMFPGAPNAEDGALEEISWDEFFEKFDASGLMFTYQDETADGQRSNFNKLTYPEADSAAGKKALRKSSGGKGSKTAKKSATKKVPTTPPARKAAGKKAPAKKAAGKKAAAKKTAAKKGIGVKAPAKKTSAKKTAAKAPAKKTAAKKGSTKTAAKKAPAKKLPEKKSVTKKSSRR